MRMRGERECKECGTQWSYYETGSVDCPECGSLHSVGVDDPRQHTTSPQSLDLTPARELYEEGQSLRQVADRAAEICRAFTRSHGFIHAGDLQAPSEAFLAAAELRQIGGEIGRAMQTTDEEEYYFLELLRGADQGERPAPDDVPESLRAARGRAYADAIGQYRGALRTVLQDRQEPTTRSVVESLGTHVKRVHALDGDIPPADAERIIEAARELASALEDDEGALVRAQERLAGLGE